MNAEERQEILGQLEDAAAKFAKPDARRIRELRDGPQAGHDPAAWQDMAGMGWLGVALAEEHGGAGLGAPAATLLARRLGYAGRLEPFVEVGVGAAHCLAVCTQAGDEVSHGRLADVLAGKVLAGLAWLPPSGREPADQIALRAQRIAGAVELAGECRFVASAKAGAFIVAAQCDSEPLLLWVDAATPGLQVTPEKASDGTQQARLHFTRVLVAQHDVLATGEAAHRAFHGTLNLAALATAAELLGLSERALDLTLEYLRTRHQFGKPIGAFQVLQHRAVDMWIQKELTRAAVQASLEVFDAHLPWSPQASAAASSAKARASHAAAWVCGQAVQLHGAIGFTDEYELGISVNRALTLAARYGNAAFHRRRYGALVPAMFDAAAVRGEKPAHEAAKAAEEMQ